MMIEPSSGNSVHNFGHILGVDDVQHQEDNNSNAENGKNREPSCYYSLDLVATRNVEASEHGFLVIDKQISVEFPNFSLFTLLASQLAYVVFLA
jgi:hypothetical protein